MTVICHDWEFYEDGRTIRPISVGLVSETGEELYRVFDDSRAACAHLDWLMNNVWPHVKSEPTFPKPKIAQEVTDFILSFNQPELWAWYGAYDHVALAQTLGGPMINLPKGVPMFTNDIKTLDKLLRRKGLEVKIPSQLPGTEHHALWDAHHDMNLYNAFTEVLGE